MHLWQSDYAGGEDEGYDLANPRPAFTFRAPGPAGTGDAGWELSSSKSAWGAPRPSKMRETASKVAPAGAIMPSASRTSSMVPRGEVPTLVAPLSGPVFAVLTPFTGEDLEVDDAALAASLAFMRDKGVKNVIAGGTTGEFSSLTFRERETVAAICAAVFPGATIANISAGSSRDSVALERQAQACGCAATMLAPPFFYAAASDQGIETFFSEVLAKTALPCFLYNFPKHTGNSIPADMVLRLAEAHPNRIRGIKDSSGDMVVAMSYDAVITSAPHLFAGGGQVYVGNDNVCLQVLDVGLAGSVTGGGDPLPEVVLGVFNAKQAGDKEEAVRQQKVLCEWHALITELGSGEIAIAKVAMGMRMHHAGLSTPYGGGCRAPLTSVAPPEEAKIRAWLTSQGFFGVEGAGVGGMLSNLAAALRAAVSLDGPASAADGPAAAPEPPTPSIV